VVTRRNAAWMACAVAVAIALVGMAFTSDVVNPVTVFTNAADLRAMHWIAANVPQDALFAVNARPWVDPAWVGVDGGYWVGVAGGRRSILPPLLYAWALPRERVDRINALLSQWSYEPTDENTWESLRAAGVTHIYCGSYGPTWKRDALLASDRVRLLHRDAGAAVFEIIR
jgi:hypothetical protein